MATIGQIFAQYIGRKALITAFDYPEIVNRDGEQVRQRGPGSQVACMITDAKMAYGKAYVLAAPHRGVGSSWVGLERVNVVEEWPDDEETSSHEPNEPRATN